MSGASSALRDVAQDNSLDGSLVWASPLVPDEDEGDEYEEDEENSVDDDEVEDGDESKK